MNSLEKFYVCRTNLMLLIGVIFFLQVTLASSIRYPIAENIASKEHIYTTSTDSELTRVNKVFVEFLPVNHSILLSNGDNYNISYIVIGSAEVDSITLSFNHLGDNILEPIDNITIPINNKNQTLILPIKSCKEGHTVLYANAMSDPANLSDSKNAYMRIAVHYSKDLDYLSDFVGWLYFLAWSISFYPQIILNWKRKSVFGLHFDFLALNVIGFLLYSLFNIGLFWIPPIEKEYLKNHPYGINPVQLNDVIFSLHAFFACILLVIQCFIYEKGDQKVSKTARSIIGGLCIISLISIILGGSNVISWLEFLYILSYMKLFITLVKYIPQAYYNFLRKSTSGWSIGNIMLDFSGGALSILQMFIIACNYNDWGSIFGDPTKFGLGLFSIIFDIFFMFQHYVLYKNYEPYEVLPDSPTSISEQQIESSQTSTSNGLRYGSTTVSIH